MNWRVLFTLDRESSQAAGFMIAAKQGSSLCFRMIDHCIFSRK